MSTLDRPAGTDLANWRTRPYSSWSFHNVRELVPTANIDASKNAGDIATEKTCDSPPVGHPDLVSDLEQLQTDSLVILKDGRKCWQWAAPHCDIAKPHIVFSISKSITAMMAGCLWGQGLLDMDKPVSHYLDQTRGSGYADATLQQLLDMQVSLAFEEDYTNPDGDYFRYRNATCWNPVDQTGDSPSLEHFLYGLDKGDKPHGEVFEYKSPNSDLLGLLVERVAGMPYAALLSELIWQPMGATTDGYVTVDRALLARGAGGVCVAIDDLARLGHLILDHGAVGNTTIIPEDWIADTICNGNRQAWLKGTFVELLPHGNYRNKCYQVGDPDQSMLGLGIHGQWLFMNPATNVVIVKYSSQADPLNDDMDVRTLNLLQELSRADFPT